MRVLELDIETAPNVAYVWRLFNDYISTDQLVADGYTLCVSAKWKGKPKVHFFSLWTHGRRGMLKGIRKMMDEADVIVHYNGVRFDIPTLNKEFILEGMSPPSPVRQVDLYPVVKRQFKFISNKLDYVCQRLGLGTKVKHKGMELWKLCMAGDARARAVMQKYNIRDVVLLEKLYLKLLPWIPNHPNYTLYTKKPRACPRCGDKRIQSRGEWAGATMRYKRFQCTGCEGWLRGERVPHEAVLLRPVN